MATGLLVVRCGSYRLGIPVAATQGVLPASEVVPVGLPELPGLVWRAGDLLPVISLAPLLGLPHDGQISGHGVIVRSDRGAVTFMVDEVLDLIEVPCDSVVPLPALVRGVVPSPGLERAALGDDLLLVVDPVPLLGRGGIDELARALALVNGASGGED